MRSTSHLTGLCFAVPGNQYSTIGSIGYYAQLGAQPLAAYLLVKIRYRIFMPVIVICWSVALCGMAASTNFSSLAGCRFLLGWFEAVSPGGRPTEAGSKS